MGEVLVEDSDSLWGQKIYPYLRVDQRASIQGRVYEVDSTSITFEEVITIKERKKKKKKPKKAKVKKEKKKKKKRRKRKEKVEEVEEEWGSLEEMNGEEEKEKVEEVAPEVKEELKKVEKETEVPEVVEEEEESVAVTPVPEEEVVVKRKITKEYFVKVRTILKMKDGTTQDKTRTYPVKKIEEREDSNAGKKEERFQVVFKSKGKKEVYLYLNGDRTISSFEADGVKYLMRGH